MLLHSPDGSSWSEVDLAPLELDQYSQLSSLFEDAAGRTSIVTLSDGIELWRWPGDSPPPLLELTVEPATPPGPPLARHGDTVEPGVVYRFPLNTHCGLDYLGQLNGGYWYWASRATEGPYPPSMESWPMVGQTILGQVTLVDETTIEYSLPTGEVVAIYRRSEAEPPGCD
jgi:hypothetical protein